MSQPSRQITLKVTGITCANCVRTIERGLKSLPGVESVTVNLALETAQISYLEEQANPSSLIQALSDLGYSSSPLTLTQEKSPPEQSLLGKNHLTSSGKIPVLIAFIFSAPLALAMLFMWFPPQKGVLLSLSHTLHSPLLQLFFASVVQWFSGYPIHKKAWQGLHQKTLGMDFLVSLGSSTAYFFSIHQAFFSATPVLYFEAGAWVISFVLLGKTLESGVKWKSSEALRELYNLTGSEARVVLPTKEEKHIPTSQLQTGHHCRVRPGDRIPADGILLEGFTTVDESILNGESLPQDKQPGGKLYAGSLNIHGSFVFEVTQVARETLLGQLITQVENSLSSKPPIQKTVDRFAQIFTPLILLCAFLTFVVWLLLGDPKAGLINAVATLVVACPCALGLASPTALLAGIGWAAKKGILFRSAASLEKCKDLHTIAFDKTGTLTLGQPHFQEAWINNPQVTKNHFWETLYRVESASEHPLAQSLCIEAQKHFLASNSFNTVIETNKINVKHTAWPGQGMEYIQFSNHIPHIQANTQTHLGPLSTPELHDSSIDSCISPKYPLPTEHFRCGKAEWIESWPLTLPTELKETLESWAQKGWTSLVLADPKQVWGACALADPLRPEATKLITELHKKNLECTILSGDRIEVAQYIGNQLGIKHVYGSLHPHDKAKHIVEIQKTGKNTAMIGDGINDAPALQAAHLGVALGSGTQIAMNTSDVILMGEPLSKIPLLLEIGKKTLSTIHRNLFWAFFYNVAMLPLAAVGKLHPSLAGAAMACSSISVVLSSLALGKSIQRRSKNSKETRF